MVVFVLPLFASWNPNEIFDELSLVPYLFLVVLVLMRTPKEGHLVKTHSAISALKQICFIDQSLY